MCRMTKPRIHDRRSTSTRRPLIAAVPKSGRLDPMIVRETRLARPAHVPRWRTCLAMLAALGWAGHTTQGPDVRVPLAALALLAIVAIVAVLSAR